jgi:hypothetical protein
LVVDAEIVARRLHARNKPRSSAVARRQGLCAHNARGGGLFRLTSGLVLGC